MAHGLTDEQGDFLAELVRTFQGGWFTLGQVCDLHGGGPDEREPCDATLEVLIEVGCVSLVPNDGGTDYYSCTPQSVALKGA